MLQEHVDSGNVQRTERMVLREFVFISFDHSRSRKRSSDERQANRLELFRRERFRSETRPEAVTIPRNNSEPCDAVLLNEIADFAAL